MSDALDAWKGVKCVVMCGGRGSRFAAVGKHKSMTGVDDRPLLGHVVDYWRAFSDDFVFIVKNGKDAVIEFVSELPIRAAFVEPERLGGIAHGLSHAERVVSDRFIVVLGDCFCSGRFDVRTAFTHGIGVQRNASPEHIRRNYAVLVDRDRVSGVEEKPQQLRNDFCGMGFYFFQPDVFDYIRLTRPSPRTGELEITDVLQTMVDRAVELRAVMFDGTYVNVNSPEDIVTIEQTLATHAAGAGAPVSAADTQGA